MAIAAVVVGTGFGARVHVPALRRAGFEVVAMVGRDPARTARRAERLGVPRACASVREALGIPGVEVVTIATPPGTHAALAIDALEAGRHVVCEKPFALNADEARAMHQAAGRSGVVALVGHEFRFAEDRATIAEMLARGSIGEPRSLSLLSFIPLFADPTAGAPEWWFDPSRGGGWLAASGSHLVDQVRTWLGDFAEVSAALHVVSDRSNVAEDTFTVRFSLVNGVQGMMQQCAGAWGPPVHVTRVGGSGGSLWSDGDGAWLSNAEGDHRLDVAEDMRLPRGEPVGDDTRHQFTRIEVPPYTRLFEVLGDLIAGRPPRTRVAPATFDDGVAGTVVLDAIRASAATGGAQVRLHRSTMESEPR